jgi:LysR family transcriptional regulator, glycine cleavage system transcriptional activator
MNSLRAFEAAARHRNFSRAAEELCVTQGAISKQVARLQDDLGVTLFRREGRQLTLTLEGARFYALVHEAFERIGEGVDLFARRPQRGVLKIKVPPTLGVRWFIPRLVHFHGRHPEMDVQITTSHQPVEFEQEDVDVAIHWGLGDWDGLSADFLIDEQLTPVCSPALLATKPLRYASDLAGYTLLHSMNRTNDWRIWLEAAGAPDVDWTRALKFENSGLTYQAAIERLGIVVAQCAFVEDDISSARLVAPFPLVVPGERAYYLVYPPERRDERKVALFREWLLEAAASTPRHRAPAHVDDRPSRRQPVSQPSGEAVQPVVDDHEHDAHRHRKQHQQQGDRHDRRHVVRAHRDHE